MNLLFFQVRLFTVRVRLKLRASVALSPVFSLASFYFCLKSNFEKVRKTAKNEENPRKSRVFRPASFKTGTLECKLLKRFFRIIGVISVCS